jgi:hypothetical protein
MNDSIDTDGADALDAHSSTGVQTSALTAPEDQQQHPTEGGSYIRYPETGEIEKVAGPTDEEQE